MPFQKNFPALGATKRIRIPEKVAPHFESVLEHLDRQVQPLGVNYIEAFFAQWTQAMRELELSSMSATNITPEGLDQKALREHFVNQYISQFDAANEEKLASQKTFTDEYIRAFCKAIRESFAELKNKSQSSSLSAWKIIEQGLLKRRVGPEDINTFHEVCYGFLEPSHAEFGCIANKHLNQCPLVESFWDVKEMRAFEPLSKIRELIAQT